MSLVASSLFAQSTYRYSIDLTQVQEDRLEVTLKTPAVRDSVVEFHIPKIVPGTYSISDLGRFVSDFRAYDAEGKPRKLNQVATNRWAIQDA